MSVIVHLDETGDHSLELIDRDFPVFGLVMVIIDVDEYVNNIVPMVYLLKMDTFGHEAVILHSYEIRKQKGAFAFMNDQVKRQGFYERINQVMGLKYTLIASFIRKQHHKDRYGEAAANPYDLALEYAMERLLPLLEDTEQQKVQILAESRGKKEDEELRSTFYRFVNQGNEFVSSERVQRIEFELVFRAKEMNLVGMQMADLAAYPIARHVIDSSKPNPAFDIVQPKFYVRHGTSLGLGIFP